MLAAMPRYDPFSPGGFAHLDATLSDDAEAREFLARGAEGELAARGIEAAEYRPAA
jgi:hypothetical protein